MSSKMSDDDLNSMEPDTLLYGALISLISGEHEEAANALNVLAEQLRSERIINPHDIIGALTSVMYDLEDMGYFDDNDQNDLDEEFSDEDLVEFEIHTLKDEDPKKRLN